MANADVWYNIKLIINPKGYNNEMKYFTAEELKNSKKDEVSKHLSKLSGKNVRYNLSFDVFKKYVSDKSSKVLDLGTASGSFLQQLHDDGYQNLYAHDIDSYLPEERKKIIQEYKIAELSTQPLPWPDNNFDVVTAWCVLPHLENPFYAARDVHRILRKDGLFIFTALHLASKASIDYFKKYKNFGSYRETNNHIALLPDSVVRKTMLKFFDLVGVDYLVIPKIFDGWHGKIRKILFNLASKNLKLEKALKKRWGYNICYILRKRS